METSKKNRKNIFKWILTFYLCFHVKAFEMRKDSQCLLLLVYNTKLLCPLLPLALPRSFSMPVNDKKSYLNCSRTDVGFERAACISLGK